MNDPLPIHRSDPPPWDAIVIGGGYAGQSAAMQLARARRRVLVVDAATPRNRFAATGHGFFGQDGRAPADILASAAADLARYPSADRVEAEVRKIDGVEDDFRLVLSDGRTPRARRLVLATGVRDLLPPVPGVVERWGRSVLHCPYCHGYEVADRPLGVLATHPMSLHAARLLPDWGPTTLFTQGRFEPDADEAAALSQRGVGVERSPVTELLGEAPGLDAVRLADGREVAVHALFVAPRTEPASRVPEDLGVAFDEGPFGRHVRVGPGQLTSVPGVFAGGDLAQAMTNATLAASSGMLAGVGAHQSLALRGRDKGTAARPRPDAASDTGRPSRPPPRPRP